MKRVVVFKSESEEYRRAFEARGFEPRFVEPLRWSGVERARLAAALRRADLAGLLLTSPRAVDALAACWAPATFAAWRARRVYTVGEASAARIKLQLGLDARGAAAGNSENLAKLVIAENPQTSKFLFPCGNLSLETLPAMLQAKGITVESITVYETKENENLRKELMELSSSERGPCCMVFFSPSGCEYVHRQLQTFTNALFHLPHFAIGNTTAHKIETLGVEVAGVAARPKADSVVESIEKYFSS